MTTGESVDGAEGYGIDMGTITFTGGEPEEIVLPNQTAYTPIAPPGAPDSPGQLPGSEITLEFGCLFDVAVPADAPEAVTTLCTFTVDESGATITLTSDETRNGIALIGGGDPSSTNLPYTSPVITGFDVLDFGDAPDPLVATAGKYPTLLANDGARHTIGGPFLGPEGDEPDDELDGQPNAAATGDDIDLAGASGGDDEDGVTIGTLIAGDPAATVTFEVNGAPTVAVYVDGWIDFNADGDWLDAGEKIVGATYTDGIYSPTFAVPAVAALGTTYVRFRINTIGVLDSDGDALDGEVEDHTVVIDKHTVVFTAGANGSISGTLSQEIIDGGTCTAVDPAGDSGYHFLDWTGDHTGTEDPLTLTNVTADMAITANFEEDPCYTGPDVTAWEDRGSPDSWCNPYQCHGDANDDVEAAGGRGNYSRVGYDDVNVLIDGWLVLYPNIGGQSGPPPADPDSTHSWISADFNHDVEAAGGRGNYAPVGYDDVTVLLNRWLSLTVPNDCLTSTPDLPL